MGRNLSNLFISSSYQFLTQISGSELQDGLGNKITGSLAITSSQAISASFADTAYSASYALNATNAASATSASFATTALTATSATSASYALNATNAATATSSSYALSSSFALTASFALNVQAAVDTGSLMRTGSVSANTLTFTKGDGSTFNLTVNTGSAVSVSTGSLMTTGSVSGNVLTFTKGDATTFNLTVATGSAAAAFPFTGSAGISGSLILTGSISVTGSVGGNLIGNNTDTFTSSAAVQQIVTLTQAQYNAIGSPDANTFYIISGSTVDYNTFATTGSNIFNGSQIVSGSITATGGVTASNALISGNLTVNGTASIGFLQTVTGSVTRIGDAFILLNTSTATRYAGLLVEDSGSATPQNYTASFFYDSQTNDWNYEYSGSDPTNFGVAMFGPEYTTKGSPTYLTNNTLAKGNGGHHLNNSTIVDDGTNVAFSTPISASAGITGSLFGTASFATSASVAISSSFAISASVAISASTAVSGGGLIPGSATAFRSAPHLTTLAATASGANSIALGNGAYTLGGGTVAIGNAASAQSLRSVAIGNQVTASGVDTVALGYQVTATGTKGININNIIKYDGTSISLVGPTQVTGSLSTSTTLFVSGAASLSGSLNVSGSSLFNGPVTINNTASADYWMVDTKPFARLSSDTIIAGRIDAADQDFILAGRNFNGTAPAITMTDGVFIYNETFHEFTGSVSLSSALDVAGTTTLKGSTILSGSVRGEVRALSITSQTASLDCSTDNFFTLLLVSGSTTHVNPSNILPGQTINLRVKQASVASGSISFASSVKQVSGSAYTPTSTANAEDIITFVSFDSTNLYLSNVKNFV
jgi:hypothetical protein